MQRNIQFTLNGRPVSAQVGNHQNLVEVLQGQGLFGARESCAQGLCGCCTVVVDGKAVTGCLYPAMHADGCDVATVEGLEQDGRLDPVQQAFIDAGAFQCGFCTPGFILMARQLLSEIPEPSDHDIRHYLSGNLCRCGAYPEIIKAVKLAGERIRANGA